MQVECVEVTIEPGFIENCYILSASDSSEEVIVVDPGAEPEKILRTVGDREVKGIVLTHRHFDHIRALPTLVRQTGAAVYAHALDAKVIENPALNRPAVERFSLEPVVVTNIVEEGDLIFVDKEKLVVIHTPGHTVGSICLFGEEGEVLMAGDTLFFEEVGRTDLPGGNRKEQKESLAKLSKLPDATVVYPGHDRSTTIGHEKEFGYLGRHHVSSRRSE